MKCALANKKCVPCEGGIPPLKGAALHEFRGQLDGNWELIQEHHIERVFDLNNFQEALEVTNKIAEIAEVEQHHPDIYLAWGKVKVTIWTHKVDGLTENDFILAAKIDAAINS